jgi:hypothetical protein
MWAQRILKDLGKIKQSDIDEEQSLNPSLPLTPFCSSRAYICAASEESMLENKKENNN